MTKRTNTILAIDLEATCWRGDPPPDMRSEIIEIGVAELDLTTLQITRADSLMVRPQHSEVSEFCTELTSITAVDVAHAPTFPEAAAALAEKYQAQVAPWASWGNYDREMLKRMSELHACPMPVSRRHLNAKTLYALARGQVKEIGLARAVTNLGLPFEGRHHRGVDDARAVASILRALLSNARAAWAK